jgi:hypothetical protein
MLYYWRQKIKIYKGEVTFSGMIIIITFMKIFYLFQ